MSLAVGLMALAATVYLRQPSIPAPQVAGAAESWNGMCPTTQIVMTGEFVGCAVVAQTEYCPRSFDEAKVLRLHRTRNDFLLYIEIDGGYHGPGTYQLRPWPHSSLGESDGQAKVAVREYVSGAMWQSVTGWLTVDPGQTSGSFSTGLGNGLVSSRSYDSPLAVDLNLAGPWRCV